MPTAHVPHAAMTAVAVSVTGGLAPETCPAPDPPGARLRAQTPLSSGRHLVEGFSTLLNAGLTRVYDGEQVNAYLAGLPVPPLPHVLEPSMLWASQAERGVLARRLAWFMRRRATERYGASMWDGPFYRVRRDGYEICFVPGAGEDLDEVCDVDMWVIRDDGDRWSGTVLTLDEVHRIMDRRRQAGEPEGDYWWCWDGLIVRDAGLPSMVKVIDGLVAAGEHETVLRHVGPEEDV